MKQIVVVMGLPGAGKTGFSRFIASLFPGACVLSRNEVGRLWDIPEEQRPYVKARDFAYHRADEIDKRYYFRIKKAFLANQTLVCDATFRVRKKREEMLAFAETQGVPIIFVECVASYDRILGNLRRQAKTGEKRFVEPVDKVLEFYVDTFELVGIPERKWMNLVKFDTERKKITEVSLRSDFAPSSFSTFAASLS